MHWSAELDEVCGCCRGFGISDLWGIFAPPGRIEDTRRISRVFNESSPATVGKCLQAQAGLIFVLPSCL